MELTEFISIEEWEIRTGLRASEQTPNEKEFGVKLTDDESEEEE